MTLARYVLAVVLMVVAIGPVCMGARSLRARFFPGWWGAPAVLVDIVIGLAIVVGVAELLGAVGLYRVAPIVAGLALAGGTAWWVGRRRSRDARDPEPDPRPAPLQVPASLTGRLGAFVGLASVALLVATWGTRTIAALRHGPRGPDTFWYHLPAAARFVQEGSVTGLHYLESEALTTFFPASTVLLHGIGMMLLDNDLLSPVLNLGFLSMALLAGWCIGRPFGLAPVTLTGVALALGTPVMVATQPGGAYSDTAGIALILAAAAVLLTAREKWAHRGTLAVAGLAAGLAAATKLQFLVPVGALSLGVVALARRGTRLRVGRWWLLIVGLAGSFWYVRNLFAVGNPFPNADLRLGPLHLPGVEPTIPPLTVAQFLFNGAVWEKIFLPGYSRAFGPVWWGVLVLAAGGLVLGVTSARDRVHRMLAVVATVTFIGYYVTPIALGTEFSPFFFVYSLRYLVIALVVSLALLPLTRVFAGKVGASWLLAALGLVLLVTQLDPTIWPTELRERRFAGPVRGVAAIEGLAMGAVAFLAGALLLARGARAPVWRPRLVPIAAVGLVALAGGFGLQELYLRERYANSNPLPNIYRWARDKSNLRIAIVGTPLQYPLYGTDLSNHVQYLGLRKDHGTYVPIQDCATWRRTLNEGRYQYVVTAANVLFADYTPTEERWTRSDPAATLLARDRATSLFRLDGMLDPAGCRQLP